MNKDVLLWEVFFFLEQEGGGVLPLKSHKVDCLNRCRVKLYFPVHLTAVLSLEMEFFLADTVSSGYIIGK